MIKTETVYIDRRKFVHTYSDDGHALLQDGTGLVFDDAYDHVSNLHTYTETGEAKEITDSEALAIITGGEFGREVDEV